MDAQGERISRLRQRMTAVIVMDEKILLIRRTIRYEVGGRSKHLFWTFPGGGQKYGETPLMALHRETRNETNIEIHGNSELLLFPMFDTPMPPGIPENDHPPHQDEFFYLIDRWSGVPQPGPELQRKMQLDPRHEYVLDWVPIPEFIWKPNLRNRDGARKLAADFFKIPVPEKTRRAPAHVVLV